MGHPSETIWAERMGQPPETSGPDFSAYADVITDFYTKHPEYKGIPFVDLMKSLGDHNYKTADQLYQMALNGELHPIR